MANLSTVRRIAQKYNVAGARNMAVLELITALLEVSELTEEERQQLTLWKQEMVAENPEAASVSREASEESAEDAYVEFNFGVETKKFKAAGVSVNEAVVRVAQVFGYDPAEVDVFVNDVEVGQDYVLNPFDKVGLVPRVGSNAAGDPSDPS